jgi:hypothetical protein
MWLHKLDPIPYVGRAIVAACIVSAVVAAILPGLNRNERFGAVLLVPCAFFGSYIVARLFLPLLCGTAKLGTRIAIGLFYVMPAVAILVLVLAPFGLWSEDESTPSLRAYDVATSLPVALGIASAAYRRIRLNASVA